MQQRGKHHKLFHYQDKSNKVNEKLSRTIFISMVQKFSTWSTTKISHNITKKKKKKKQTHTQILHSNFRFQFTSLFFFFFFTFVHAYKSSNGVNKTCKQYREKYKQERKCFEIVNAFHGYFNPTAQRSLYFPCAIFERGIFAGQSNIRSLCGHSVILSHRFNPETASIRRKPAFSLIFAARFSSSGWKGGRGEVRGSCGVTSPSIRCKRWRA